MVLIVLMISMLLLALFVGTIASFVSCSVLEVVVVVVVVDADDEDDGVINSRLVIETQSLNTLFLESNPFVGFVLLLFLVVVVVVVVVVVILLAVVGRDSNGVIFDDIVFGCSLDCSTNVIIVFSLCFLLLLS